MAVAIDNPLMVLLLKVEGKRQREGGGGGGGRGGERTLVLETAFSIIKGR